MQVRTLSRSISALSILLVSCTACPGQQHAIATKHHGSLGKIGHYVLSHKELLVADSLVALALSAEAASSIHCQNVSTGCYEINPMLGARPSQVQYWGSAVGVSAGIIAANHLFWRDSRRPFGKHGVWVSSTPAIVVGAFDTRHSVNAAETLQQYQVRQARARVMTPAPFHW